MSIKQVYIVVLLIFLTSLLSAESLENEFRNPPRKAGVRCWWWWLNSNVTKEAVTRDLEAMHDKGFSGAMIFDAGTELGWGPDKAVPNGPVFSGPRWTELYLHVLREAKRLDMEIGLSIQSGWNLGGPYVTLDDKAKQITYSEILVQGARHINRKLDLPKHNYNYYRDICVLAYPAKIVESLPFKLSASSSQSNFPVSNITGGRYWVSKGRNPGEGPTHGSPEWVGYEFEKTVTVSGLNLTGRKKYGPKLCRIEAMDSGQKTGIFKLKDGFNELSFDEIAGKSIRIIFEDSYDPTFPDSPRNVQLVSADLLDKNGKSLTGNFAAGKPIKNLTAKTGARELGGSAPDCRFLLDDYPAVEGEQDTMLSDIVDITDKLRDDDNLQWDVPPGRWTVLRIGYTPTRAHVATSSDNWKGHVLDYLSRDVFNRYWNKTVEPLLDKAGDMAGTVLTQLETDSWECGGMNWSPGFAEDFRRYNGYDIIKYLPVVAGKIVDNRQVSNAFLADFRKTIAHLVSENHYRTFAQNAARYNIGIQPECSGPHAGPIDGITNYSHSDIMMSEFWIPSPHRPDPPNRFFVKQASSAAHIYGKRLVGAESFTSLKKPHWGVELWYDMKPHMDYEFCEGLNMVFFHTFTCSPKEMGIPGQEYFAGTHVNPQVTWWDYSGSFMNYINRVQSALQKGKFVADVLYYYGDHVPNIAVNKGFNQAGSLPGYDYDVTNEQVLLKLKVRDDGRVIVPGGLDYRVLVLPDHKVLSLAVLKKIEKLLNQGATVIGPKPERLVSLVGGQKAQEEFHKLADKLWDDNPAQIGQKKIGKGRLVWGQTSRDFLQSDLVAFDFEVLNIEKQEDLQYIHYTFGDADIYFVSNQTAQTQSVKCRFRVSGKQPELWDPVTGQIITSNAFKQSDGKTTIPLQFDPCGSCLIVFRDTIPVTRQGSAISNYSKMNLVQEVAGPWIVAFDTEWGGPASVKFESLADWTKHADEGIRYYSGKAVYTNVFNLEPVQGKRYWIQLNNVLDAGIAAVKINGKNVGIAWTKPFRLEITDTVKAGRNRLEIIVVNTWQNRLIGDRGKPQKDRFTETNIRVRDEWQLRPSGLIGPVEIKVD